MGIAILEEEGGEYFENITYDKSDESIVEFRVVVEDKEAV